MFIGMNIDLRKLMVRSMVQDKDLRVSLKVLMAWIPPSTRMRVSSAYTGEQDKGETGQLGGVEPVCA